MNKKYQNGNKNITKSLTLLVQSVITGIEVYTSSWPALKDTALFIPPDKSAISHDQFGNMVRYGREFSTYTAKYIGPGNKFSPFKPINDYTRRISEDVKINPTIWLFFSISASLQKSLNSLLFADFAPCIKEK